MDQALNYFLRPGTLALAFAVYILTFFVRSAIETAFPILAKQADENEMKITYTTSFSRWYNQVILYAIPVIVGISIGVLDIPFIFGSDIKTLIGRCFFGGVVGWFSSFFYKVFKRAVAKSTGINVDSIPPAEQAVDEPKKEEDPKKEEKDA